MHGDTIEILPIDYAIVFVWNMVERERLNNENLDSDKFYTFLERHHVNQ